MYDSAYLIAAQLVFAYAFDMVLTWSRRERYTLGFGPFPIIFSINLFLWFKVDWFYWQFLMIAIGFTVKELVRWNKDGRRTHIFNPSSFPLGLFSLVLIVTGTTRLTWGPEIATTLFDAPHIYPLIFAVSLPAQVMRLRGHPRGRVRHGRLGRLLDRHPGLVSSGRAAEECDGDDDQPSVLQKPRSHCIPTRAVLHRNVGALLRTYSSGGSTSPFPSAPAGSAGEAEVGEPASSLSLAMLVSLP